MYGIEEQSDLYDWMGSELHIFNLLNPNFDPEGEPTYENVPFHSLLAIASGNPEKGLDLFQGMLESPASMMMGITVERTEFNGMDALLIPPISVEDSLLSEMFTEEQKAQIESAPDRYSRDNNLRTRSGAGSSTRSNPHASRT